MNLNYPMQMAYEIPYPVQYTDEENSSKTPSSLEIKIETPESFTRKKSNVNHNQLLLDISKEQEINIEESENDDNQKRFKFSRKKKESKINNVLYIDSTITSADTAKEKFNYVKWRENGNLTLMNKQLEAQKKIELDRYIYEKLKTIINKNEESLWKACPDDFDEEKTFEYRLKDNNNENLVKSCFLEIIEMDETEKLIVNLESLNPESLRYRWGRIFLHLRKEASRLCLMIAKHPLFEFLSLLVLIFNCITILIDNSSLTGGPLTTLPILVKLDNFFFFFYIFELTIKVVALGFIMNNGAYLSSGWNILDFFIISTAIINKVTFEYGINLKSLRSLRVLRPLKILASLKKLQIILESLFSALPLLADSFLFLTFCYLLYALAGLQLFPGLLKKRCIYSITGLINPLDVLCGNVGCEQNQICSKLLKNPNYGLMSFDNLFYSFLNVFQIVTVDNWTSIMYSVQKTFSNYASIYFLSLVIIGGLFLVNLTLAIIKVKFSNLKNFEKKIKHTQKIYDFLLLKEKKIWIPSHNSNFYGLGSINKKIIKTVDNDSAKSMKKNRIPRNIFSSDHLLSHLKSEIYKLTDGITSHVSEIGKAPDQIGKSAGIDKLNKVINKFSLFKKNKRISFEINDDDNKNEDLNKKYLKLQICSFKNYESTSTYEVKENSNISEKILRRHVTTFKNFSKSKITKKFRKKKGKFLINYHLPNHVKPEENINFFLKIPLIKKQTLSLQRPNIVNSLDMIPKIDKKSIKGEQNIIFTAIEKFNYEETRKKISENIKDMVEFREQLEQCFFNNEYIFVELFKNKMEKNGWSGNDILKESWSCRAKHIKKIIRRLASKNEELYAFAINRILILLSYRVRNLVQTPLFVDFIFVIVVLNGGILCLDGLVDENYLLNLNYSFTLIFTIEMSVKIWGLGIKKYIRDKFNIMDAFIVFISIFEILLFKTENSSIDYLRALRSVRVFRLFKILRHLEYFKRITSFISKNFYSFIYIACLLILFNFVYGMLGMDIFTNILITDSSLRAYSFGDFAPSFICAFDILTLDNWSNVLIIGENSDAGIIQAALYSISWIFIGNYILMNLFLAVLLDGLTNELMEEEINKTKKKLSASSLEKQRLKEIHMQIIYNNQLNSMTNRREIAAFDNNLSITTEFSPKLSNPYEIKPNDLFFLNKSKCNYSLFLFGRRNLIRRICHKIAFHSAFELIILIIIILSCIKMVIDTYTDPSNQISLAIDNVTIGIFLLECLLKIIAKGFLSHEDTYLRESWNQLDFFIVLGSVVSIIFEQLNIPFITVVRILRVMRPLRFISKNANIKIVVVALIESLQGMLNVSFIILMIWIMFATFGVSIYRDRFGYCGDVLNFNTSIQNCHPPLKWKNYTYNFDNIYNAMFTLLVIATFDGWIPILSVAINSNTSEFGPTINYSRYLSYIYFVLFIIVIPVFFINLFIGVIFYHFVISEKKCKNILLTESQIRWINLQKLIIKLEPKYAQMKIPKNKLRKFFYNMVNHRYFEIVISLVICGSIINMSLIYDDAPQWYLDILNVIDQVFLLIFLIEITMKILGFGIYRYFSQKWNQFDFFIMIFGLFDIIINKLFSQKSLLFQIGPKILRTVRMLRIGRLIRLVKKFDGILKLIRTLIFSLPMTFNVLALLLLIFFVYTIIGCSIFGDSRKDEYVNFTNFLFGMMTLFKISTTDNWSETMLSLLDDNIYCPIYFVTFIIISQFVVTNLFILVLLQQFAEAESSQDSKTPLQEFHEYVDKFRTAWIECTEKFQGHKMNKSHLLKFFRILESPLGFKNEENVEIIAKFIMEMKIIGDKNGFIYFNELLFKTMRNVYGPAIFETSNPNIIRELKRQEKRTIQILALNQRKKKFKRMYNKASISVKSNKQLKVINPLAEFLYFRLFFSSWKNFTMILKKKSESYLLDGTNPRFLSFSRTNESQSNQSENLKMIQEENNEDSGHFPSESNLEEEKETTIKHSRMQNNREVFQNLDGTFNDYSRGEL